MDKRMHFYGKPYKRHIEVVAWITIISLASALGLAAVLRYVNWEIALYVDAPAAFGFLWIWYRLFDKWIWRTRLGKAVLGQEIVDFSGKYRGEFESTHDDGTTFVGALSITQTYNEIFVTFKTDSSTSGSIAGSMSIEQQGVRLHYVFRNEPKPGSKKTMLMHYGTAVIHFGEDKDTLEMEYYTGRFRENRGYGVLKRVET